MEIEIFRKTKKRIENSFVKRVVRKTLAISGKKTAHFSFSIVFADKDNIRKMNRKYRKKNKPTDVLSFGYSLGYNERGIIAGLPAKALARAGEIILCPEVIEKSAKENKVSFKKELAFVLSHGILHLLGMRHGKKMYGMQDKISNSKF